jgi:hypothetical protein
MTVNEQSADTVATEATEETTTQAERTYTQRDVDDMMARMKTSLSKKLTKSYEDLGDPEELRNIVESHKRQQQEQALKRGEFDRVMADLASKKDAEISKRDEIIREFKVEQPLLSLAAKYRSVNPEQVKALLKNGLRLNEDGEVEVIDSKTGTTKYRDNGKPYDVETYVKEFLDSNPHFVSATPATTNTQGNLDKNVQMTDLSKLDLTRADHRKIYAQARREGKL